MSEKIKKQKKRILRPEVIVWFIRLTLIISILLNCVVVFLHIFQDRHIERREVLEASSDQFELISLAVLALILTFLPNYIERRQNVHFPQVLELTIILFMYSSIYLSARYELYYRFFWWDDLLHTLSGVITGFIGFLFVYRLNHKYTMNINPLFIALFAFTFSVTFAVFWEIFEFIMDVNFGTNMQRWNLPESTILMGKHYQGSGLRDTMSDLILASIGALGTSVVCYFLYKNEKRKALKIMRETFPEKAPNPDKSS